MRTPETVEPATDRQVVQEIPEGRIDAHANEQDFGVIPERTMEMQDRSSEVIDKFIQYGNEIQVNKMKNAFDLANNTYLNQAQQTKGVESAQYLPSNETGNYKPYMQNTVKNVLAMAQNDEQKNAILAHINEANVHNNDILQKHVGQQIYDSAKESVEARADVLIKKVPTVVNSPSAIFSSRNQLADIVKQKNDLEGGTQDTYKAHLASTLSTFDGMVMTSLVESNNIDGAKAYVDNIASKGDIDTKSLAVLQKRVTDLSTTQDAQKWYLSQGRMMKDTLARPDLTQIQTAIDKMDLTPEKRQIWEKTLSPMIQVDKNADIESSRSAYEGFKNWFSKYYDQHKTNPNPVQIENMAKFFAPDSGTALTYDRWANGFYKTGGSGLTLNFGGADAVHQNKQFQEMRFQIQTGQIGSVQDLDAVQKDFTAPQFMKLRDEYYKFATGTPNVGKQAILKQARALGADVFGADGAAMGTYVHAMMDKANDIGDGDMHKLLPWAQEYLKGSKPETSSVWQKQVNANIPNDTLRGYYADYGKELTDMMVSGYRGKQFNSDTMANIINALGGPEKMQRFTPTNNAVLSILRWNQDHPHNKPIPLTVESVNEFEEKYKTTGGIGFAP